MSSDYQFDYYSQNDDASLRDFWQRVWTPPPLEKNPKWFSWILRENPNTPGGYVPWLLAKQQGKVVAQLVLMPTVLFHNGKAYTACWGRDLYVEKEHRRNKLAVRLYDMWVNDFEIALASGQSEEARHLQNKYGWTVISDVRQYEKLFLRPRYLFDSLKSGVRIAGKRCLAMAFSQIHRLKPAGVSGVEIRTGRSFDCRVDELWATCSKQYSNICARDYASLHWRFENHPYVDYVVFEALDERSAYGGYCVGRIVDETAYLVDSLTEKEETGRRMRQALIRAAESYFWDRGVVRVVCRCVSWEFEAGLREAGYLPTRYSNTLAAKSSLTDVAGSGPHTGSDWFAGSDWYATSGDSDLDR